MKLKKFISVLLFIAVLVPTTLGIAAIQGSAADDPFLLGSIAAKYESNNDPGCIGNTGDIGGKSYGAYQFASNSGVPLSFARWCISSAKGIQTGNILIAAYTQDGSTYGSTFDSEWRRLAANDRNGFLLLQHDYVKATIYDMMVSRVEASVPGFKVSNYGIALQNVIWSRALQHGVYSSILVNSFRRLGGFNNQPETEIINAIYDEASEVVDNPPSANAVKITQSDVTSTVGTASYARYSHLVGRYLSYFAANPGKIQVAVYVRLSQNERADAIAMYNVYGGNAGTPSNPSDPSNPSGGNQSGTTTDWTNITLPDNFADSLVMFVKSFITVSIQIIKAIITLFSGTALTTAL